MIKIVFIGPESSGKTTLCKILSKKYNTVWVREMCRVMAEEKVGVIDPDVCNAFTFTLDDFIEMAKRQNKEEEEKSKEANKILFCDNDSFSIGIWCERYLGVYHEFETKNKIYMLTKPNVAFVQDGLRDGEHIREWMYERFIEVLDEKKLCYYKIDSEDYHIRLEQAINIIDNYLNKE